MTQTDATAPDGEAPPFPQGRTCPLRRPESYMRLGERGPMSRVTLYDGAQAWLVTGHEAARELQADPRLSVERDRPGYPFLSPRLAAAKNIRTLLVGADPPSHDLHRRLLNPHFSLKRIRAMRPAVERIVNECIDDVLKSGPPADLVARFTVPVPSMVISHLLGVPYADHEFFHDAMRRVMLGGTPEIAREAVMDLLGYLDRLITTLRGGSGGEGVLARMAVEHADGDAVSHQELVQLAFILLVAGHETVAGTLSLGVIALLEHPDQLADLRAEPAAMAGAVEELVRYVTVIDHIGMRVATEDFEIAGTAIRAGDGVIISGTLANRDPSVFTAPEEFDIRREDVHRHVTFGTGIHQCLGQNLARLELDVAITALINRIPALRLAVPAEDLPLRSPGAVDGVTELPVTW